MFEGIFIVRDTPQAIRKTILWGLAVALLAVFATDRLYLQLFPEIADRYGPSLRVFAFGLATFLAAPLFGMFFFTTLRMGKFNAQLKEMARRDGLTGLLNRNALEEVIHKRAAQPDDAHALDDALIIIDIDHFKAINDTHGHAAGDHVLRMVSVCVAGNVFERDFVARLGGEEFAVYLVNAGATGAVQAAERIRSALEDCRTHYEGEVIRVTASLGGALFPRGASYQTIYQGADFALYRAKRGGRNLCEFNGLPTLWHTHPDFEDDDEDKVRPGSDWNVA
ncbi:MAG: GGDEF domain-containing protein [Oricola sp.]